MSDPNINYLKARYKASHNSYLSATDFHRSFDFNPAQPWQGGCRSVECDIWRRAGTPSPQSLGRFTVAHTSPGDTPLANYLGYLLSFHFNNPQHEPILLVLDIKDADGSPTVFSTDIDLYLREWFDAQLIFTPFDLVPKIDLDRQLWAEVQQTGWPTIGQLAGKFIVCLSGDETTKAEYANMLNKNSLCFSDYDLPDNKNVFQFGALPQNRIFINMHIYADHHANWKGTTTSLNEGGRIVRAWVIDDQDLWDKALDSGINALASDKVAGFSWASVGPEPYVSL